MKMTMLNEVRDSRMMGFDFPEPIRFVIWDLDETFWSGTLTEGGVQYREDNHKRVVELAKRGIVSAICSKNDHSVIEGLLREHGIWDYFAFSSINWEPKGGRIADIIAAIQLRPSTVLFIDDNLANLEEARFHAPGLQVATPDILSELLELKAFRGKNDETLSRLKQYKLLELRHSAMSASPGENINFLRESDIRVRIEYDVEKHIERAIELINRTNQLNFTKKRLPEDITAASEALRNLLRRNTCHAGLVYVQDRFGDHGCVGLFAYDRILGLVHFCFSCRILNMHVERWLYSHLGRPKLEVQGEVISDLFADGPDIDWIRATFGNAAKSDPKAIDCPDAVRYPRVFMRGGCDVSSLTHYFTPTASVVQQETNLIRNGLSIRIDHSLMLKLAIGGVSGPVKDALRRLGFVESDFKTTLLDADGITILSFWADASVPVYRHKQLGFEVPFWIVGTQSRNLVQDRAVDARSSNPAVKAALATLREEYAYAGLLSEERMYANYRNLLKRLPDTHQAVLLLCNELGPLGADGKRHHNPRHAAHNRALTKAASDTPGVRLVDVAEHLSPNGVDLRDFNHFDRMVYHRIYEQICSITQDRLVSTVGK